MSLRTVTLLVLALASPAALAELTCEEHGAIAQETVRQRDEGKSLKRLLADVERGELKDRLTPRELALVKDVIRHSFNGALSPAEVVEACKQGGALLITR